VCRWTDDGSDDNDLNRSSGANGRLTLAQARANYREFGACDERFRT
jgi:hypothetical protein